MTIDRTPTLSLLLSSRFHAASGMEAVRFASLTTKFVFLFTFFFALIEISSYRNIALVDYGLFGIGIVLLLTNLRLGFFYYLVVNLLSTDSPTTFSAIGFSSVHTTKIAGLTITTLWTLLIFFVSMCDILKNSRKLRRARLLRIDRLMLFMGFLFVAEAILGIRHSNINLSVFISDASYYINMFIAYLTVRLSCRTRQTLRILLALILASLIVRAGAGLLYFIIGIGEQAGSNYRAVTDSIRNIFPLLVLIGAAYLARPLNFQKHHAVGTVLLLGGALGVFNVINYASRGNMLLTFVGIITLIMLNLYSQSKKRIFRVLKSQLKIIASTVIIIGATAWFMDNIRPGSLDYVAWKLTSFTDIAHEKHLSSAAVRWLEYKNIVPYLWDRGNILWGEGLGGWFEDKYYPFATSLIGATAYADDWILQGRLYKPHGTQLVILLKMGIGGLIIYYGILISIFVNGTKILCKSNDPLLKIFLLAILSFLPLLYYKNFISKLQIFMGISIGAIAIIQRLEHPNAPYGSEFSTACKAVVSNLRRLQGGFMNRS